MKALDFAAKTFQSQARQQGAISSHLLTNIGTGVVTTQQTNAAGFYSFQSLPVGTYTIEVEQKGFKSYKQTGVVVDVNSALVVDVAPQVGQAAEMVEVSSSALHVDTASTQMGEVITGQHMTDVPLDGRSYTDLLPLQPGVVSQQSGMYEPVYKSSLFPVKACDFPALSWGREKPLDLRTMFSCPEFERAAYHEAVWFPHQNFLGSTEDTDAIVNAIHKVLENLEELRGLDHKAILNQKLGRADCES